MAGACPPAAAAGFDGASLTLVWLLPFVGVLASIALLPLLVPHFWHRHFGKIAFAWAAAFVVPFAVAFGFAETLHQLAHAALLEYVPFVLLIFALYTVSGGIGLFGDLQGSPRTNVALLVIGALLANVMGTTGAAMILIRPLIRANRDRRHNVHVFVFFLFIVANAGGALTPLGDPPLFLGFLNGVSFGWSITSMLAPTGLLVGALLALFYGLDRYWYARDGRPVPNAAASPAPLRVVGRVNLALLACIVGAVLLSGFWKPGWQVTVLGAPLEAQNVLRDVLLVVIALVSLKTTPAVVHEANGFEWGPMREVAKLFAAIFATIIPAIAMLRAGDAGPMASLTRLVTTTGGYPDNTMYFWCAGLLSAFLDNAPTYLVFFNLAGGDARALMAERETLQAISGGAVYMGALTYIGNAPNLMVRAIAEHRGIRMPSFFGYMAWSVPILLPLFALLTIIFFR